MAEPVELRRPRDRPEHLDRSRSYFVLDATRHVVRVGDLDFAAFLVVRGLRLIDAMQADARSGAYDFYVPPAPGLDMDQRMREVSLSFVGSPEALVLAAVRSLKKVVSRVPPGWDPFRGAVR